MLCLMVVGCGDGQLDLTKGGLGEPCYEDDTCESPYICEAETCVESSGQQGGLGQPCYEDDTCDSPYICEAGTCVESSGQQGGLGQPCYEDDTCDSPYICEAGTCVESSGQQGGLGQPCYEDDTCDSPYICEAGTCVESSGQQGGLGEPCYEDDTCESPYVCEAETCVEASGQQGGLGQPCYADDRCDSPYVCEDATCVIHEERGGFGQPCHGDGFCDVPYACDEGTCHEQHDEMLNRQGTLWAPFLEWRLTNGEYSGNPYDVIAEVLFTHDDSAATHKTQMFFDGGGIWRFRFTGTQIGRWTFTTSSDHPDLDGHTGTIMIAGNPDPSIEGFLTSHGTKFAMRTSNGGLRGHVFNVFMNLATIDQNQYALEGQEILERTLQEASDNGSNSIFVYMANYWFQFGTLSHRDHNSENPDRRTFAMLENTITTAHARGMNVHIWAWGDEDRRWTPIGAGGINGIPDRRVQRYIAARLGPLPGWTMGYGFDLFEWVSASQVASWADYLKAHMGWERLLMARQELSFLTPANMDVFSTDDRVTSNFYGNALHLLSNSSNRPVLYERRFTHMRDNVWTMDTTRRAMWQFTMAGGAAGFWGFFNSSPSPYPHPEQLRAHQKFWRNRFLLDMAPANELSNGVVLRGESGRSYVFYAENSSSIQMDLSGLSGPQPAVAIDTMLAYEEIDLGDLEPMNHTWSAPYQSDWAIAVGLFNN